MTEVGLVWAQSTSGVIGRGGDIPWQVPEDLARFKELTMGHTVVMGRRTWDSLPAAVPAAAGPQKCRADPPDRLHGRRRRGGRFARAALSGCETEPEIWVIGGEQIYMLALPQATRCEVTEIDIDLPRDDGDAVAPVLDETWLGATGEWQVSSAGLRYRFHSYRRP